VQARMKCASCGMGFCFYHSSAHEEDGDCAAYEARLVRESRSLAKAIGAKECPGCKRLTEKNGGCNHMTCQQCSCHWCWVCSERIDGNMAWHYSPANEESGCMQFSPLGGHPPPELVRMVRNVGTSRAHGRWRCVQLSVIWMRRLIKWWFAIVFSLVLVPVAIALFALHFVYTCVFGCFLCLVTCGVGVYYLIFRNAAVRDFLALHCGNLATFNMGIAICFGLLVAWLSLLPLVVIWSVASFITWLVFLAMACKRPKGLLILLLQVPCDGVGEFIDMVEEEPE